jgi:hypothetical protein
MIHGVMMDDIDDQVLIICKKKKEKNKNGLKAKVYLIGPFLFCTQDTIEDVSDLRSIVVPLRGEIVG